MLYPRCRLGLMTSHRPRRLIFHRHCRSIIIPIKVSIHRVRKYSWNPRMNYVTSLWEFDLATSDTLTARPSLRFNQLEYVIVMHNTSRSADGIENLRRMCPLFDFVIVFTRTISLLSSRGPKLWDRQSTYSQILLLYSLSLTFSRLKSYISSRKIACTWSES